MALTNWNDILNKPKGIDQIEEIALEVSELSSSVLSISEDVNKLKTKLNIFGYLPCFVTSGKSIILSFPLQGDINYNHIELSKTSSIAVDIYGDKSAVATTFSTTNVNVADKVVYIAGEIPENIETFVTLNRIQCMFIKETLIATLSNVTQSTRKTTKKK